MSSSEMSAVYLDDMIKDIIHELAFELHWAIKTNHISFEYLYECPTIEDLHVVIQKYRGKCENLSFDDSDLNHNFS